MPSWSTISSAVCQLSSTGWPKAQPAAAKAARITSTDTLTRILGRRAIQRMRSWRPRFPLVMVVEQERRSRGPGFTVTRESSVSPYARRSPSPSFSRVAASQHSSPSRRLRTAASHTRGFHQWRARARHRSRLQT